MEEKEDNVILNEYKHFLDNKNNTIYQEYVLRLEEISERFENTQDSIPGFVSITSILSFIHKKDYKRIYNLDCYSINEDYDDKMTIEDGIIVKDALIQNYDKQTLTSLYNSLYNTISILPFRIDLFMYYNARLIKQSIFTYNIQFDKNEFFNRCTEDNYNYLRYISIEHIKLYHEKGYSISRIISTFNEINLKFSKGKKGFLYLFWIPKKQNKLNQFID